MQTRELGQGLTVSSLGLGCMMLVNNTGGAYGAPAVEEESFATLERAVELGVTMLDTAEIYGPYTSEIQLGKFIAGRRDQLVIATKFGFHVDNGVIDGLDGCPENVIKACEGSLKRLNIDCIDLYYQHRVDPAVPIEDTVGAMSDLVAAGKVKHIGLSEAPADLIRRAHAVHPLTAVQSEYSLWERGVEAEVLPTLSELGIGFVPYSPLGRGFLTGQIQSRSDMQDNDFRSNSDPRYSQDNFDKNLALVSVVKQVAERHNASPAQIALAWLLSRNEHIVPIPGCKRRTTLEDSMAAVNLSLTEDDQKELDVLASQVSGRRYAPARASVTNK